MCEDQDYERNGTRRYERRRENGETTDESTDAKPTQYSPRMVRKQGGGRTSPKPRTFVHAREQNVFLT